MLEFFLLVFGICIGAVVVYFNMRNRKVCKLHGVAEHVEKQQSEKQARKARILELLREKGNITNDDIEQPLGISHSTAANYLHELVQEGKIERVGERGRFVSYHLKK